MACRSLSLTDFHSIPWVSLASSSGLKTVLPLTSTRVTLISILESGVVGGRVVGGVRTGVLGGRGEGRGSGWGMRSRLGLATGAIWVGTWAISVPEGFANAWAATLRRILVTIVDSRREECLEI